MSVTKPGKIGFRPVTPAGEGGKPSETKGPVFDLKDVARLLPKGEGGKVGGPFYGAPVWSGRTKEELHEFVSNALESNMFFKDKDLAREKTAEKVCEAIQKSPQLTAMFIPKIMSKIRNS